MKLPGPKLPEPKIHETASHECHDGVCVTCSDAAVQVTVVELLDDELALVETGAGREEVSVALVPAEVGDIILVHAREAIAVVRQQRQQTTSPGSNRS